VKSGGNVVFRVSAPKATEVLLRGQWAKAPLPMQKDANGLWTVEAHAVPAGIWEYSMLVDGLAMIDPSNPLLKPMREPRSSLLHLPADPPAPWDFQDVPHGAVHHHSYLSRALQRPRELLLYTPPGYESAEPNARYPLLVLQHGSGDLEATWVELGKAHWILDSLIAAGKARPMLVLMLNSHPLGRVPFGDPAKRAEAITAFQRELFEDAPPLVESRYRVEPGPAARAIAGLSMGGGQSLATGLAHLDRFAWIGSFSGAVPDETILQPLAADPAAANARIRLLWIAVGRDDSLRARNEELIAKLKAASLRHEWQLSEGAHTWPVWRQHLVEFAPLLFQPAGNLQP
jgi:enterochelin esterase family protein